MKDIKFYINEALKVNSKTKMVNGKVKIEVPIINDYLQKLIDAGDYVDNFEVGMDEIKKNYEFRSFYSNLKPYVVFRDKYRGNDFHISTIFNMKANILCGSVLDYESFKPEDIVFTADTLDEIGKWCFEQANIEPSQSLLREVDDFDDYNYEDTRLCEQVVRKLGLCDSEDFLYECMTNPIGLDKEFEDDHKVADSDALKVYDLCLY